MRLIDTDEVRLQKGFFEKVTNVPKFYEWLERGGDGKLHLICPRWEKRPE